MDDSAYKRIAQTLAKGLQGAPIKDGAVSPAFLEFLTLIYTPEEAEVVQYLDHLPGFMTDAQVAEAAGRDIEEVRAVLKRAHDKYALMGEPEMQCLPTIFYILNFHHRYPDTRPGDLEAAALYREFFIEEGFYRRYETSDQGTPLFRTLPVDRTIDPDQGVLTSEEAHDRIDNLQTDVIALVPCPCRTRTEKTGTRECRDRFPIGYCVIPGGNGEKFIRLGMGRRVDKAQAKAYIDEMVGHGLVINSDNYKSGDPMVICACCGCCCSMTRGRTRWDNPDTIAPSNFLPQADDNCVMCGACVERCLFGALRIDEAAGRSMVEPDKCVGCGVCVAGCPTGALTLHRHQRTESFENVIELAVRVFTDNMA